MPPTPNTEGAITETPASQVSSADFDSSDPQLPSFEDILARSPIAKMLGLHDNPVGEEPEEQKKPAAKKAPPVKEPEEEVVAETPAGDEDVDNEEIDEESVEAAAETEEGESGAEEEDDIDWEYKIPVEIDGKTEKRTLGEVRAAFAAKEVLKAREAELTALKASAEAAYAEKLKNVEHLGTLLFKELLTEENLLADEYRKVVANIAKARESKDTFALTELKDQKESIQEKHAVLKSKREASARAIATELKKAADSRQEALLAKFQADIPTTLPGFNEKLAAQIRSFAIQEGIPEELLEQVYDAKVIKFINDYRMLKMRQNLGAAKRKQAPTVKGAPVKAKPAARVAQQKVNADLAARVLSGDAGEGEELAYIASLSKINSRLQS